MHPITAELMDMAKEQYNVFNKGSASILYEAAEKLEALQRFKDFVHGRLDKAGVPVDPPGEHRDAGCRIGQRLDVVFYERDKLRHDVEKLRALLSDKIEISLVNLEERIEELEGVLKRIIENKVTGPSPVGPAHGAGIAVGLAVQASIARTAFKKEVATVQCMFSRCRGA